MKEIFIQCHNQPSVSGDGAVKGHAGYYLLMYRWLFAFRFRAEFQKKRVAQQSLNIQFPGHK